MNIDRKKSFIGNAITSNINNLNNSSGNNNSSSNNTIKGLQIFIADLRATQHSQDHERRIKSEIVKIKQHFQAASQSHNRGKGLDGYQRKKYVAKLAYIYITTNTSRLDDIFFGTDQILQLLRSNHFSEKFMGYMILELLMEHPKVVHIVGPKLIPLLLSDLTSNNDTFTGVALNFIAIVGNIGSLLAYNEDIVNGVFQIVRSPTSPQYLKKKSTLAFLALLKGNLSILTDDPPRKQVWIQKIVSLLDDTDNYRITLTALPLVEYIARYIDSSYCFRVIPQLTDILYTCIVLGAKDHGMYRFPAEYKFANIPNPWLITKIVSLLSVLIASPNESDEVYTLGTGIESTRQHLHASDLDPETLNKLRKCVIEAISLGNRNTPDVMERIVQNTILFSIIKFATKLDPSKDAIISSVDTLCSLLNSHEINIRYLTLDSLIQLCASNGKVAIDAVRFKNLDLIIHLMNIERDMSILRKLVDLLYTFADVDNVQPIVDHLLKFLLNGKNISDPTIRSNISVKIAILTEKYATDPKWYIQTSLKILSLTIPHVGTPTQSPTFNDEELWYRLCQIVVNNSQLRSITCHKLLDYLVERQTSEYIVKTSAFLLGEYPSLVMDKITIENLFTVFAERYFTVSNLTKAMILTTMIKLYKFAPQLDSNIIKFYQLELNSLDTELQTRSFEYLKIIQISKISGDMDLINILLEPMPAFNTKSNPLLKRLGNLQPNIASNDSVTSLRNASTTSLVDSINNKENTVPRDTLHLLSMKQPPLAPASRRSTINTNAGPSITNPGEVSMISNSPSNLSINPRYVQQRLSMNWKEGFTRMLLHRQGIFYQSPLLKIIYRITTVSEPYHLKISFIYVNQTEWNITALSTEFIAAHIQNNPEYIIQNVEAISNPSILPHKRVEQNFQMIIRKPFDIEESPLVNVYFKCGSSSNNITLKLGIGMISTLNAQQSATQSEVTLHQFITRWKTLGDALGKDAECQMEDILLSKPNNTEGSNIIDAMLASLRLNLKRIGLGIIEQTNVSTTLFVAGIIHTKTDGNFGCLLKFQCQPDWRVNITCKTTVAGPLASYVVDNLNRIISG